MDDKTVRIIVNNAVTSNLTPIFKEIFGQMKCVNCKKYEPIAGNCEKFDMLVERLEDFGCIKFEINETKFDLPEADPTEVEIDLLKNIFMGHSYKIFNQPQKHVAIFNGYAETEATIELDNDYKIVQIYTPGSTMYDKTIKKMIGLTLIGLEE